jgi:hypothetical protein
MFPLSPTTSAAAASVSARSWKMALANRSPTAHPSARALSAWIELCWSSTPAEVNRSDASSSVNARSRIRSSAIVVSSR